MKRVQIYAYLYTCMCIVCHTEQNVKAIEDWIVDLLVYVLKGRFYGV